MRSLLRSVSQPGLFEKLLTLLLKIDKRLNVDCLLRQIFMISSYRDCSTAMGRTYIFVDL